jgi:cobaltochelatase CobN
MSKAAELVIYGAGAGLASLGKALKQLEKEAPGSLTVAARGSMELFDRKQVEGFLELAARADMLMVILHGGKSSCPFFDELMEKTPAPLIYVHPGDEEEIALSKQHSRGLDEKNFTDTVFYIKHGGRQNWLNLLKSLLPLMGGPPLKVEPPHPEPCQALYHPRLGVFDTLAEYLAAVGLTPDELLKGPRPVIGTWFANYLYLEENTEPIDQIFNEIERQGCLPLTILWRRYPDPSLEVKDTAWVLQNYFHHQGNLLPDAMLSPMSFSISLLCPGEEKHLKDLNLAILQAPLLSTTREFWEESDQAVSPMDVSMSVCAPEGDGNLITLPAATRETSRTDPLTGARISRLEPIPERIEKLVRMGRKWAALKRKPNHEKKVAIVFHNYPPRNDRIGCAAGLDSFASVALLVERLKKDGYQVERTWDDPQELAEEMVGSLSNDQRWLTPEAMARRAAGLAGAKHHQAWQGRLPNANLEHMTKDWGDSPGELFVHQDRVMINGVINGNVYLGIQPPRGFIEQPEKSTTPICPPAGTTSITTAG